MSPVDQATKAPNESDLTQNRHNRSFGANELHQEIRANPAAIFSMISRPLQRLLAGLLLTWFCTVSAAGRSLHVWHESGEPHDCAAEHGWSRGTDALSKAESCHAGGRGHVHRDGEAASSPVALQVARPHHDLHCHESCLLCQALGKPTLWPLPIGVLFAQRMWYGEPSLELQGLPATLGRPFSARAPPSMVSVLS